MSLPRPDIADGTNLGDKPIRFEYRYLVGYLQNLDKLLHEEISVGEYVQIALLLKMITLLERIGEKIK